MGQQTIEFGQKVCIYDIEDWRDQVKGSIIPAVLVLPDYQRGAMALRDWQGDVGVYSQVGQR